VGVSNAHLRRRTTSRVVTTSPMEPWGSTRRFDTCHPSTIERVLGISNDEAGSNFAARRDTE
jgi:hypothetical protein